MKKLMQRFYTFPGLGISWLLSISPSFRLSSIILKFCGANVVRSVTVHSGVRFVVPGRLQIGAGATINSKCFIDNRKGIFIGANTMIGRCACLYTLGHNNHSSDFESIGSPIYIGRNVVVYPHTLIMPGVTIGDCSVIYPGSVVVKDVLPYEVVGGNPAKPIGKRADVQPYDLDYKLYFGI